MAKQLLRAGWRAALGALNLASMPFVGKGDEPRIFYGGARAGNLGGPLVKVRRLQERYPSHWLRYNLVYILSNAPYLPPYAIRLLKMRNVPIVHNQNGVFYSGWFAGDWAEENRRMSVPYHAADHVFFQSEFCRASAERFLGERKGSCEVLYNAVDTERFRPSPEHGRSADGRLNFLISGKIDDHLVYRIEAAIKGLHLARASGLRGKITVAGWVSGTARARLQAMAGELALSDALFFAGTYTQEDAPGIYNGADAFIMLKHNDPCPNTVLGALASGLPVLYSNSGLVPELVGTEAGVPLACSLGWDVSLAPEPDAIAAGMLRLAAVREAMSAEARSRAVRLFDIEHWYRRHDEVFRGLLRKRRVPGR